MISLLKQADGMDTVVMDLSPLREPDDVEKVAENTLSEYPQNGSLFRQEVDEETSDGWITQPIYRLPPCNIVWEGVQRSEAKTLAKQLAEKFGTAEGKRAKSTKRPNIKAGKNRRHGGYGIG